MDYDCYRGIFNADLLASSIPSGEMGLPLMLKINANPGGVVSFDKALSSVDYKQWVHFFIHDYQFVRIWHNPWRYLPILSRFEGVIAPDFSIFWDLPLFLQIESIGKSRLIGSWLQQNGLDVIPCIRWGKSETYPYAFGGIESGGTVAVGSVGCMANREAKKVFEDGFPVMLDTVKPKRVVVYGSVKSSVFSQANDGGVEVIPFSSSTSLHYAGGDA